MCAYTQEAAAQTAGGPACGKSGTHWVHKRLPSRCRRVFRFAWKRRDASANFAIRLGRLEELFEGIPKPPRPASDVLQRTREQERHVHFHRTKGDGLLDLGLFRQGDSHTRRNCSHHGSFVDQPYLPEARRASSQGGGRCVSGIQSRNRSPGTSAVRVEAVGVERKSTRPRAKRREKADSGE